MPTLGIANNLRSVWSWKLALASGRMVVLRWSARDDLSTMQNLQGMTRLHAIGDTLKRQKRLLDVVFVHGAGGHYLNSWGRQREEFGGDRDSMLHWLLTEESLSEIGVWSLEHESDKSWWGSQGSLERQELVRNLLVEIGQTATFLESSPEQPRRPICWIAHSEGGNVVKSLLKYCQEERGGTLERAKVAGVILDATQSVYFIDTPHRGSWVARFSALGLRKRVRELREADPMLIALDTWYADNMDGKARSLNFYQSGERYKVVGTASVMLNRADNFAIDRNHNKIATPESRDKDPYRGIHLDLQRIHAEIRQQLSLVPAAPLQLERNKVVLDGEPLRLLCFVEPELGAFDPAAPGRGQSKTFRVKFWLSQRDSPPARLEESWIEGVSAEHLADSITGVYCDQLNESPDGRLLLALFLPQQDLVADGLPQFLQQLRHSARGSLPNSTGIPLLLACSSRWAVGSSAHPRLSKTRSDLRKASIQLHHTLFADTTRGNANLGCLNWLMIDPSIDLPPGSHRSPRPCTISSVATDSAVFQDHGCDADDAIDPLANRNAIYLSSGVRNRSTQGDLNPMDPLLMRGIPLIWCEKQLAPAGDQPETAEAPSSHPMDSILAWDGLTFLSRFYRYQQEKPGEADQPNLPLRRFIRDGIIFWEDHRHIPTEATSPRSDSPASVTPFTVPFHPNRP